MHLLHARDGVEAETAGQRVAVRGLLRLRIHRPRHAAERTRGEPRNEAVRLQQRRAQRAVPQRPGGGFEILVHSIGVANARIAATIPASAAMSQKRIVTFSSGQPISSKWLWSGDIRKIRLPRSLNDPT